MSFHNDTNKNRAKKIEEILAHLDKSAQANKATPMEIVALLRPVMLKVKEMIGSGAAPDPTASEPASKPTTPNVPQWVTIREMCEQADFEHLGTALAVYMNRFQDELDKLKEKG